MRTYTIPPDTREKEKIIGGIFTLTQFIFLVAGVLVGALFGFIGNSIGGTMLSIVFFAIGLIPFVPFAFVTIEKMGDIELFKYCMYKYKYKKSVKDFANCNQNYVGKLPKTDIIPEENRGGRK